MGTWEKAKNHKYVAREEKSKGKYIYFYDINKWKSWKDKIKTAANEFKSNWKTGTNLIKQQSSNSAKSYSELWKSGLGIKSNKKETLPSKPDVRANKFVVNYGSMYVSEVAKSPGSGKHKYIAKMKTKDGKTRYFYTQKQLDNWLRVYNYQATEPDFMKDVKEIEPDVGGDMPTQKDNSTRTNPEYSKHREASVNCWHCSTAYDLRKRGYDVSAQAIESVYGPGDLGEMYHVKVQKEDQFKKTSNQLEIMAQKAIAFNRSTSISVTAGSAKTLPELVQQKADSGYILSLDIYSDDYGNTKNVIPAEAVAKYANSNNYNGPLSKDQLHNYEKKVTSIVTSDKEYGKAMAESVRDKINEFPNDSWGRVGMYWNVGGGHSIVWEKDSSGEISFIDAQVNKKINIEDYMKDTTPYRSVDVQRTDNLELKQAVMSHVTESYDDNPSEYYDDTKKVK